jgi:hypothetical protein
MTTYTFDKKIFMEQMEKYVKDDEFIIFTNTPCGSISASKKAKGKLVTMGFAGSVFAKPDTIADIVQSKLSAMIVCKKNVLSDEVRKEFEEVKK